MKNYIFPFLWMRGEPEEVIRNEIRKIAECGIGALCVEARPHKDFCGTGWWHDMDIVMDEAKKCDMKIWILDDRHFPTGYANGLIEKKYPERKKQYIACTTADVFGSRCPLTLNISRMLKPTIGFWEIGKPVNEEERARNVLLSVVAAPFAEGNCFCEETIDLTPLYTGEMLSFTLPEGQWRIHVIYKTRTDGGNDTYINMIDTVSASTQIEGVYEEHFKHYGNEFGKTISGFFSDEPQFGNTLEQCFDTRLGKSKMQLPWSSELAEMLQERYGEKLGRYMPFLFAESTEQKIEPQLRYDYMDCLTKLYERDFSRPVGEWCRKHGVEYIGHVVEDNSVHSRLGLGAGHWFRAMAGQDMAGIDAIGGQIVYGAPVQERKGMVEGDGEFFHYALGKMGASAGHLDPMKKGRTMCELFGAYGWNFGVRNMKYLLDHLLTKGINYLVPHAFSMAEYPDIDCPPHFYAGGNNPEFPWFVQLMKYANRMCNLLNGGTHAASAAVLYDGEADWTGERMPMQKICRQLTQGQIEFDIVCLDMLDDLEAYHGSVTDGKLQINQVMFDALLIPYAEYLPQKLLRFHQRNERFPIYFVGGYPQKVLCDEVRETVMDVHWPEIGKVISIEQIMPEMIKMGLNRVSLHPAFSQMNMYHYQKDGQIVMFQNESAEQTFSGTVLLPFQRDAIYYDGYEDVYYDNEGERVVNGLTVHIELAPGESCVLLEKGDQVCRGNFRSLREQKKQCEHQMDLSENWKVSWVKAKEYPCWQQEETEKILRPFSEAHPNFSGIIRYEKEIELSEITTEAFLELENVYEVVKAVINGKEAGMKLTPPYLIKIGKYLRAGKNKIILEAATTPGRDQLNYLQPPFDFSHEAMEPTGIYGKIKLNYR